MKIRRSVEGDIAEMERIFAYAREFMRSYGNTSQWGDSSPSMSKVLADIDAGNSYCVEADGAIVATFALIEGDDPTYAIIRGGEWLNDRPYGTIHRLASDGSRQGVAKLCLDYAFEKCRNIRVDTHEDNVVLRGILEREGFVYCGVINIDDGSERLVFQRDLDIADV